MNRILFSFVGNTDPMKSFHDGPLIHIVRHYHPDKVYAFLSKKMEEKEEEHQLYSKSVKLVNPKSEFIPIFSGIEDASDFDVFTEPVLRALQEIQNKNPNSEILINITSGTLQMISATCLLVASLNMKFKLVQVKNPDRSSQDKDYYPDFDPKTHEIEDFYNNENLDSMENSISRCYEPGMLSYKEKVVQSQIYSLCKAYDYEGALNYLNSNSNLFELEKYEKVKLLLEHGKYRLNFSWKEAEKRAQDLGLKKSLYPVEDKKAKDFIEFFMIMCINQMKGDLSSFVLKLSPLADDIAKYIITDVFGVSLKKIAYESNHIFRLDEKRANSAYPGISNFLDDKFIENNKGAFQWNTPMNYYSMIALLEYFEHKYKNREQYETIVELKKWSGILNVRNQAAHTLSEITEDEIRSVYGANSKKLCARIEFVLRNIFKSKFKEEILDIYNFINRLVEETLES